MSSARDRALVVRPPVLHRGGPASRAPAIVPCRVTSRGLGRLRHAPPRYRRPDDVGLGNDYPNWPDRILTLIGTHGVETGTAPLIEGSEFTAGPHVSLFDVGDETLVRGDRIDSTSRSAIGIFRPTHATIDGNVITRFEGVGIEVWLLPGTDPLIRGNTIAGGATGIHVMNDARPTITGNDLFDNGTAIGLTRSSLVIEANRIHGNDRGVGVGRGPPTLRGNTITDDATSIDLAQGAAPTLSGNAFCGNGYDLGLQPGAEPPVLESNYGCPGPAVAG